MSFIGGTIRAKGKEGTPLSGLQVAVKGTGFTTTTDSEGRFRLGSLLPGDYTLVVWPEEGKPKEKPIKITVPIAGDAGEYDLEL
jgi:hypothetical protein